MLDKIIVDADLCIKLGRSSKYTFLKELFPLLAKEIFVHTQVKSEVLDPRSAVTQLEDLISSGCVTIVDESKLEPSQKAVFDMTFQQLSNVMLDPEHPRKNKGEVCSLSYAKAVGIPIFATDESKLQIIIDKYLNVGINDITCLRIESIIQMIKSGEINLSRKQAKLIWKIAGKDVSVFDNTVWPAQS